MARKKKTKVRSRGQIQNRGLDAKSGLDRWLVRVYLGTHPGTGKRQYSSKTVVGRKRDAEKALTEMLHEVDSGAFVEPAKVTVQSYFEGYMAGRKDLADVSLRSYKARLRGDVYPHLGSTKLDQVTPQAIFELYNVTLYEELGRSPATIASTHKVLRQGFEQAVLWGMLAKNPCDHQKLPKEKHAEAATHQEEHQLRIISPEQVRLLLEGTKGTRYHALWHTLLTTGMRPGEALALQWQDLRGSSAHINKALTSVGGGYKVGPGKTKNARRVVRLPESTLEVLREHRERQQREGVETEWVFSTVDGNSFLTPAYASQIWTKECRRLGLVGFRLYDTRHTHATTLLLQGVSIKVVSERLGHASTAFTMDVYASVLPEMQEGAADAIDQAFFNTPQLKVVA